MERLEAYLSRYTLARNWNAVLKKNILEHIEAVKANVDRVREQPPLRFEVTVPLATVYAWETEGDVQAAMAGILRQFIPHMVLMRTSEFTGWIETFLDRMWNQILLVRRASSWLLTSSNSRVTDPE